MRFSETQILAPMNDKIKVGAAALLFLGGIVAFYWVSHWGASVQWGVLLFCLLASLLLFAISFPGKKLLNFSRDGWREAKKVVWPSRKETLQVTMYVFGFVILMALFLLLVDKSLEFLLYDLLLGWRK